MGLRRVAVLFYCRHVPTEDDLSLTIRCQEFREAAVRLHGRYFPDEYGVGFSIDARAGGLRAELGDVRVWGYDDVWLPDFIAGLAADYRGWTGERTWETGHLSIRARWRAGGHVALTWALESRLARSDSWHASMTTWLEAGEQMTTLAADLSEFLPLPKTGTARPPRL